MGGCFGGPTSATGSDLEFLLANGFTVEKNLQLALIGDKYGACRPLFLREGEERAGERDRENQEKEAERVRPGNEVPHQTPLRVLVFQLPMASQALRQEHPRSPGEEFR